MDQPNPNFAGDYDTLLELVKSRASVRKLKPDPIPDDYVTQILEVGRGCVRAHRRVARAHSRVDGPPA
jgi:hypothetical protein